MRSTRLSALLSWAHVAAPVVGAGQVPPHAARAQISPDELVVVLESAGRHEGGAGRGGGRIAAETGLAQRAHAQQHADLLGPLADGGHLVQRRHVQQAGQHVRRAQHMRQDVGVEGAHLLRCAPRRLPRQHLRPVALDERQELAEHLQAARGLQLLRVVVVVLGE